MREFDINPIIKSDYPDPDVIRVNDTYYMCSTTMHFLPGGAILRSYDLVNWELVSYVFDTLDNTPAERLELEATNYGAGMWAPTLRYHDGKFYVAFVSHHVPGETALFVADNIEGPWERRKIEGYYHDCSLLFDDDGRVFIVYGNREIHLTELEADLTGPKKGGVDKIIIKDTCEGLGYEGAHFYKIKGKYYIFLIDWPQDEKSKKRRIESCFMADKVDGEYKGKVVLNDDCGFFNQGVAQGGIVDTPTGKWYGILFRDNGAVGRIPVLVPVTWKNDFPVFGVNGHVPDDMEIASSRPYYRYEPVFASDSFKYPKTEDGHPKLKLQWQWNHCPDPDNWRILEEGGLEIRSSRVVANVTHAINNLTQRCMYPKCEAEVTIDASEIREGDVAGLVAFQGLYGYLGITKDTGDYYLIKVVRQSENFKDDYLMTDYYPGRIVEKIRLTGPVVTLCLKANFEDLKDMVDFYYLKDGRFVKVGTSHHMQFRLDHFCGARFGLFLLSTKSAGGKAVFKDFDYRLN